MTQCNLIWTSMLIEKRIFPPSTCVLEFVDYAIVGQGNGSGLLALFILAGSHF